MYQRVIPRDLFNESKLLKCLGQLALMIHEGVAPRCLRSVNSGREFRIDQRLACGGLYVASGLNFRVGANVLELYTTYNSKESYPLLCNANDEEIEVFHPHGTLTIEFVEYVESLKTPT